MSGDSASNLRSPPPFGPAARRPDLDQWKAGEKAALVSLIVVALVLYAVGLLRYAAAYPNTVTFIDPQALALQLWLSYLVLGLWMLLGLTALLSRRRYGDSPFFAHAPVQLFAASNSVFAYLMGQFTAPYGAIVMIGGVLASLTLFGRRVTILGLVTWGSISVALTVLEQSGMVPYGPLLRDAPFSDGHLSSLWLIGMGSITVTGVVLCAVVSFFGITQLQARDRRLQLSQQELVTTVEELRQSHAEIRRSHEELEARVNARTVELRLTVAELERANGLKSEFVATMSHELRTPLSVILGYSDLLLDKAFGPLTESQIDTLTRLTRSAASLFELVDATLDLSRLEAGTMELVIEEVSVSRLLTEVTEAQEERAAGVKFLCAETADLGSLWTDGGKLKVVLRNLLSNAFKFTEHGSVTLSTVALRNGVEFSVRDTGPGIPRHMHEAVFDAFRQVDGSPSRVHGGAGLGLNIVRQLVGMLNGEVSLTSEAHQGSTFHVWIPAQSPHGVE